jgi:hypothetical protein
MVKLTDGLSMANRTRGRGGARGRGQDQGFQDPTGWGQGSHQDNNFRFATAAGTA